jgi:hypothetical protein
MLASQYFGQVYNLASKSFRIYGGDDGARTRDLCRDSYAK